MQITELVWKLFLLLLPGVVATLMLNQISGNKKMSPFNFLLYSALLGITSYIIMEIGVSVFNIIRALSSHELRLDWGLSLTVWDNLFANDKDINKLEIILSYLLSIPLGIFYGFIISKKLFHKLFQKLGFTNRYGDNDVWSFFLNSPETQWILLRDKSTNLTYFGNIRAYSDTTDYREILLNDVTVFTSDTWEELYNSESVYLELESNKFSIEIPKSKTDEENKKDSK
jgi:hypothetical protein